MKTYTRVRAAIYDSDSKPIAVASPQLGDDLAAFVELAEQANAAETLAECLGDLINIANNDGKVEPKAFTRAVGELERVGYKMLFTR